MPPTRARKLDIVIGAEAKGDGFKKTASDADKLADKLKKAGDKGGKGLKDGVESGANKLGDKLRKAGDQAGDKLKAGLDAGMSGLESAGSAAADAFSSGFDFDGLVDMAGEAFSSLAGKLGPVAGAAGVATAGAFAVGLMNGMETEVATDRLAAQLGGSDWAEGMGEVAGDLYLAGFGESVTDTADAVRDVFRGGLLPEDATKAQIQSLTGDVMQFADIMEQDMGGTVNAVSQMMRTGLIDNGTQGLDLLTRAIQNGDDKAGDLLDTFNEYSTNFRTLGLEGPEAFGLIHQAIQAGARDSDMAGDALKEFSIRAIDGSEATADAFEALGLDADAMSAKIAAGGPTAAAGLDTVLDALGAIEDPLKRNQVAADLFGTQSEDMAAALAGMDLDTAVAGLGSYEGALRATDGAYDNASSKIEMFKREALDKLTTFVGEEVIPKLESLSNWAKENPGAFQVIAGIIGGVLVVAFAAWAVSAGLAAAATIAATWPILAIGAAIAGLAALVVIHFDTIRSWVVGVFNWIKTNWPLLLAILTGPFGLATLAITRNWGTIKRGATAVKDWVIDKFAALVDWVKGLPGKISNAASGMWDGITSSFRDAINAIIDLWNGLSFPSVTVGGQDPLGSFGPSLPEVTIGGWDLPNIPHLAEGGIVTRPTLALLGEGRHNEAVLPLDGSHGTGGDTYVTENTIIVEGTVVAERELAQLLNKLTREGRGINLVTTSELRSTLSNYQKRQ